jgi:hypothetical protein
LVEASKTLVEASKSNEVKDRGLVEDVVVAMEDVEAVAELLQTLAELISTPSLEL